MKTICTAIPSTDKNTSLHITIYTPRNTANAKGMIQVCHGMTEHMGRYGDFAKFFTDRGYIVFGNDIISHGKSVTTKSSALYLADWFDAVNDVNLVREHVMQKYPGLPVYLLGFSLGSFIVRSMKKGDIKKYSKEILVGTGQQPAAVLNAMEKMLSVKYKNRMEVESDDIKDMAFDSYNKHFINHPDNYWLIRMESARKEYENDKFVKQKMSPAFFCQFLKGMAYTAKCEPNNDIPSLILYGRDDPVGDFGKGVKKVYEKYKKNNPDTEIVDCFGVHDILHDVGHDDVFEKIVDWIEK